MKINWMIVAILALASLPAMAKPTQSNGTREHMNQYHDRTPHIHEHGAIAHR